MKSQKVNLISGGIGDVYIDDKNNNDLLKGGNLRG